MWGLLQYAVRWRKRQAAASRLRVLLGDFPSPQMQAFLRGIFLEAERFCLLSYLARRWGRETFHRWVTVEGEEQLRDALEAGRGVVVLVSHLGVPRLMRRFLELHGYDPIVLGQDPYQRSATRVEGLLRALAERLFQSEDEAERVSVREFGPRVMKRAFEALRANRVVFVAGDGQQGEGFVEAPFLGGMARFPVGGVALGDLARAPLLPCFVEPAPDGRFRVVVRPPLSLNPSLKGRDRVVEGVKHYARMLEKEIRAYPAFSPYVFFGRMGVEEAP